jgi:DNA mismatch repair protein MutL
MDAVIAVYGINQAREMIPVNSRGEGLALKGYIGKPSLSRSNRSHINIIINGRYVHCPAVAAAVEEAYRTLLPHGRRPVAVLSLTIASELLDINIHPSKLEIRLLKEKEAVTHISRAIRETLLIKTVIPSTLIDTGGKNTTRDLRQNLFVAAPAPLRTEETIPFDMVHEPGIHEHHDDDEPLSRETEHTGEEAADCLSAEKNMPELSVVGQIGLTYILAEGAKGLYIVDQHAAHERILYEDNLAHETNLPSQCLLLPVTLELDYREAAFLTQRIFWFNRAGFIIEYFGGNSFLLRGVPPGFAPGQEKEFFADILEYFQEKGAGASFDEFSKTLAAAMACRSAVKAGEKLTQSSMDALCSRLAATENPYTCPHGRPTIIHLSFTDLEKKFKR